jgi:Domain of unknown function (DUF1992)
VDAIAKIAEAKIQEAMARGEFDNVAGSGRPLRFEDARVPPHLRAAYKLLRNAGLLPPEMEARGELYRLDRLIAGTDDPAELADLRRRRRDADLRYSLLMDRR